MASASSDQKLRDFLLAQSPVWLSERLLSAAAGDPVLLAGLQAAASGSDGAQVVRRALDRAIWMNEYVEWDETATYVTEWTVRWSCSWTCSATAIPPTRSRHQGNVVG